MNGNLCPWCGKSVMNYRRFVTDAEPTKSTTCCSCGAVLKRSPTVWLLVSTMLVAMLSTSYPLFTSLYKNGCSTIAMTALGAVWLASWVMLANFLSWQLVKWLPAKQANDHNKPL